MFNRTRVIVAVVALLAVLPGAAFLHFYLPRHDVVRIIGVENRRVDMTGKPLQGGDRPSQGRDVYYIFAEDVETKVPHVYRNEDTGWGFPFYLKFDSADEQAVAASIASEKGIAVVTKYGWRLNLLSWFPNAVNIRRSDPNPTIIPWFNIIFFAAFGALAIWIWRRATR
ncbi:DUF1523 family protein [Methylopila sp. 73B]|uniref:DUF1523 family protein n=1 Tax=Methylopila sp. 73B TaxID=1120792 RepID=UPI0003814CA1|nr:DUF1523 family protein [Methylopila sp. 73B]